MLRWTELTQGEQVAEITKAGNLCMAVLGGVGSQDGLRGFGPKGFSQLSSLLVTGYQGTGVGLRVPDEWLPQLGPEGVDPSSRSTGFGFRL